MLLASCGSELKFHRWPTGDYHGLFQLPEITTHKQCISWCKKGELLATTSSTVPTVVYVGRTLQTHMIIDVPQVQSLAFSQVTQSHIMLGTSIGNILLYDIHHQEVIQTLPSLPAGITYLGYGANDSSLAAACKNEHIYLYNSDYNISSTFCVPDSNNITAMAYHNTQPNLLAAAGGEGTVVVWDSNTGNAKVVDKTHSNVITDLAFSSGEEMVTVGLDHKFIGYDLRTKSNTFSCTTSSKLSAVRILPNEGDQIAVASIDGKLYCYDKRNMKTPFNTILAHYPNLISRLAFQSVFMFVDEDVEPDDVSIAESKVTTVVFKPQVKRKVSSVVQNTTSVEDVLSSLTTNGRFSPSDYHTPASGDFSKKNTRYATFIPFGLRKSSNNTHTVSSCTNLGHPPVIDTAGQETSHARFLNRQKGFTDFLKNISCTTAEMNKKFEGGLRFVQTKTIENWFERIPSKIKFEDGEVAEATKELEDFTKDTFDRLNEFITKEFIKLRWSISKSFIKLESKINLRWEEFNSTFMQFSGCEIEDIDDSKIDSRSEMNKIEKGDDGENCVIEPKSKIPVFNFQIK